MDKNWNVERGLWFNVYTCHVYVFTMIDKVFAIIYAGMLVDNSDMCSL